MTGMIEVMPLTQTQQLAVYNILTTPIKVDKKCPSGYFENGYIVPYSCSKDSKYVTTEMTNRINSRAKDLSESKYAKKLWDYFNTFGLIQ